jgi:hypothetical protein
MPNLNQLLSLLANHYCAVFQRPGQNLEKPDIPVQKGALSQKYFELPLVLNILLDTYGQRRAEDIAR